MRPARRRAIGLAASHLVLAVDSRRAARLRQGRRLDVARNRVDARFTGESALSGSVVSRMRRLYLSLPEVPIDYSWNGPIYYSSTGFPYFGPLTDANPAILVGVGYSGNGVVPTVLGGRIPRQSGPGLGR